MFRKYLALLKKFDWVLLIAGLILVFFSLAAIYSVTEAQDNPNFLNFKKQAIFFIAGIIIAVIFGLLDYRYFKTYGFVIYLIGFLILTSVLILGVRVRGTRGWLSLFFDQTFQPVELAKIILIIVLARIFSDWRANLQSLKNIAISALIACLFIFLVMLQPDFGSALILIFIYLGMLFFTKIKKSYLLTILIIVLILGTLSWFLILKDYQKERVLTFLSPHRDPWGAGYNVSQSIISIGSGQFFGRGLGLGPQSRLNFLPSQETDFIFAVIAEQLGFLGSCLIMILFIILFYRMIKIAVMARDDFAVYLSVGLVIFLLSQTTLNIGMNLGLLPIAGVPLPYLSYGGSSLLVSLFAIGLFESIYLRRKTA